jgi:hypothetical protein
MDKAQAIAAIERESRRPESRAGWFDRRPFDRQMRTPGYEPPPFSIGRLPEGSLRYVGTGEVPLDKVRTEQPSVSVSVVKNKIANGVPRPARVVHHNGLYWTQDGNHGITADRAMAKPTTNAKIYELQPGVKLPALSPAVVAKGMSVANRVAGPMAIGAIGALAYQNRRAAGGSQGEATADAVMAGGRTALTGMAIGSLAKSAAAIPALRGAASVATRAVLPLSIAGHALGYAAGAWSRGEDAMGIAKAAGWGAINGIVPIDLVRDAVSGPEPQAPARTRKFKQANASFEAGQAKASQPAGPRRGWSDNARIAAAQSRGASVLPYGGVSRT